MEKNNREGHAAEPRAATTGLAAVAKVVSWEGKARATAEGVLFRPLASAASCSVHAAQGDIEELGCLAHLLSSVELFYNLDVLPATKTPGRHRLVLRSTTRPCTENTREVATSELLAVCAWVVVIASLVHGDYPGLVKTAMISRSAVH